MVFMFFMSVAALAAFTVGSSQRVVVAADGYVTYVYLKWWVWLLLAVGVESLETREGKWAFIPTQVAVSVGVVAAASYLHPSLTFTVCLLLLCAVSFLLQLVLYAARRVILRLRPPPEAKPWQELEVDSEFYALVHGAGVHPGHRRSYWSSSPVGIGAFAAADGLSVVGEDEMDRRSRMEFDELLARKF